MKLHTRLDRLEQRLPPPPDDREEQRRWNRIASRFMRQTDRALALATETEQKQVAEALNDFVTQNRGPLARWLGDLREGRCRLPELSPEVMKAALLAWFHPDIDYSKVCNHCGLEYPDLKAPPMNEWRVLPGKVPQEGPPPWYDLPRVFDVCPGCGASTYDITWSHLTEGRDLPWKSLDCWLGARPGRKGGQP